MNIQTTGYVKLFKEQYVLPFAVNSFMIYENDVIEILGKYTGSNMLISTMKYSIRRGFSADNFQGYIKIPTQFTSKFVSA